MDESIRVHGKPRHLESVIAKPMREGAGVTAVFDSKQLRSQPIVFARPFGNHATRVRLKFPPDTPPGSYKGTVRIGDTTHTAVVDIAPEPHLRIVPTNIHLSGTAGQQMTLDFSVVNSGNVVYDIRKVHGFGLFAEGGIEDALGAAYRQSERVGQERVAIVADKLAEAHGGLARMEIESGAGSIKPDEVKALHASLRLPDNLKHGRQYTGVLRIQNAQCEIHVDVPGKHSEEGQ